MNEKLNIEYCENCEDIYAIDPLVHVFFEMFEGETMNSADIECVCRRCKYPMIRYEGFIESLRKRESSEFISDTLNNIDDLTDDSKEVLKTILESFSVPSFTAVLDGSLFTRLAELTRKRYATVTNAGGKSFVTINAFKLGLFTNEQLLYVMKHQKDFLINPSHLTSSEHSLRRQKRINALINDFTDDEKDELMYKFDGKCALTGKDVPIHMDHVIPVSIGHGGTTKSNMLPIWQRINSSKSNSNIFEWYKENGRRFEVCPDRFENAVAYLAELNGMTVDEYREYVYECHANPIDVILKGETN